MLHNNKALLMITTSLLSLFIDIIKTGRDCFHWFQPLNGGNPIYVYIYTVNNNMRYINSTSNIGIEDKIKLANQFEGTVQIS